MEPVVYVLLGALIAVLVFAILMPMRQGRPDYPVMPRFGPYWAHGGGAYRPGILY